MCTDLSGKSSWIIEATVFNSSFIVKSFDQHWNVPLNLILSFCCLAALTTILDCAYPALPGGVTSWDECWHRHRWHHWQVWVRPAICHPLSPGCNEDVTRCFKVDRHFLSLKFRHDFCDSDALCLDILFILRYFHSFLKSWGVDYDKMLDFVTRPRCTSHVSTESLLTLDSIDYWSSWLLIIGYHGITHLW